MKEPAAKNIRALPPYLFSKLNKRKQELRANGVDIIDLGIGDPDLPTPDFIKERLIEELNDVDNMRYSSFSGCDDFRYAVAEFYQKYYHVELDPDTEILTLIGSKEGIAHLIQAMVDPTDTVLVPDPCYPVYIMGTHMVGASLYGMSMPESNGFCPEFDAIPSEILKKAKLAFLNYPGNPTGATVDVAFFEEAVRFFKKHGIWLAHDSAYNLVTFGDYKAPSVMEVKGAKEIAVEFGSLSKAFNMTGWRIGYIVGNPKIINLLKTLKSNLDSSQFLPIQKAAASALKSDLSLLKERNAIYEKRADVMIAALKDVGIKVQKPKGSIFLWASVPEGETSASFCEKVMVNTGVIITPGPSFGAGGEGYFRISLSVPDDRLIDAANRIREAMKAKN
ncbi:MAG: aminotransferase class I/II-fold pyridoxal phosphate-dependent enzyme [Tuberibacillus sp.]